MVREAGHGRASDALGVGDLAHHGLRGEVGLVRSVAGVGPLLDGVVRRLLSALIPSRPSHSAGQTTRDYR